MLCLVLALAGCGAPGASPSPRTAAIKAPPTVVAKAEAPPPPPPPTLGEFQDMSAADVVAALGEPDFRRVEPPAEVWQYRGADCVVDLFLYHDGDGLHVAKEDARNRDPAQKDTGRCRNGTQILRSRIASNSG